LTSLAEAQCRDEKTNRGIAIVERTIVVSILMEFDRKGESRERWKWTIARLIPVKNLYGQLGAI
jgi:hypothetical protein